MGTPQSASRFCDRRVECFRRNAENRWELYDFTGAEKGEFASIGLAMPMGLVFEDVEAETEQAPPLR